MKQRLSILLAAIAALFATPFACFASVNPVLFAAIINDVGLLQFGVGAAVSIVTSWLTKHKTPLNNRYVPVVGTLLTAAGFHWLGGMPFNIGGAIGVDGSVIPGAISVAGLTTVATGQAHDTIKGIQDQGASFLKETPADRAARKAKAAD